MPGIEMRETARNGVRYVVRVRDPNPRIGRSGYTSATFATEPEAERFVRDVEDRGVAWALHEYHREKDDAAEPTLDDWAKIHFEALTKPSADTIGRYRRLYAKHWQPELGHMHLSQITRIDVARALNGVEGKDKTVLNAWGVLTHMLKMAAQDGKIPRSPTIGVIPPRRTAHETVEHRYLTEDEFWRVLDATPDHWQPLIMMLAGTGMRWGEAAALTVGDIDTKALTVKVTKAEKRDADNPSKRVVGPTKSRKSRRTITLPVEVVDAVRPLLDRPRTARLFLPPRGGPLRHKTFYVDIWQKTILAKVNLDGQQPRLHDLRHSHVAWLIAAGASLPVIQARLGHEKITTTIDTYGHLLPDVQRAAADAASMVLGKRPKLAIAE